MKTIQSMTSVRGGSGLVFALQRLVDISRIEPGSGLLYENGASYFFLDGECRYWVQTSPRASPHTGHTTPAQMRRLFGLGRLAGLVGSHRGGASDGATVRVSTRGGVIECTRGCAGDAVPTALEQSSRDATTASEELWQQGTEVDGALRVLVVSGVKLRPNAPTFRWPLRASIAEFSVTIQQAIDADVGVGRAVTSDADVAALLDLRRRYLELSEFQRGTYIAIMEAETSYALWMRRTTPLENDQGIVPVTTLLAGPARP